MDWDEAEYLALFGRERRRYAWVLRRYGGLAPDDADAAALRWYDYEAPGAPYRGLVFHDEAWHWAMLRLYGETYPAARPELAAPPPGYEVVV